MGGCAEWQWWRRGGGAGGAGGGAARAAWARAGGVRTAVAQAARGGYGPALSGGAAWSVEVRALAAWIGDGGMANRAAAVA